MLHLNHKAHIYRIYFKMNDIQIYQTINKIQNTPMPNLTYRVKI